MEPNREASGMQCDHCLVATGQNKPHAQQASSPTKAERSTAGATELLARVVEITGPCIPATIAGSLAIQLRSQASRATRLGLMLQSRHGARPWYMPHRLLELYTALRVPSQLARA
jgi:hypothetical protein